LFASTTPDYDWDSEYNLKKDNHHSIDHKSDFDSDKENGGINKRDLNSKIDIKHDKMNVREMLRQVVEENKKDNNNEDNDAAELDIFDDDDNDDESDISKNNETYKEDSDSDNYSNCMSNE